MPKLLRDDLRPVRCCNVATGWSAASIGAATIAPAPAASGAATIALAAAAGGAALPVCYGLNAFRGASRSSARHLALECPYLG